MLHYSVETETALPWPYEPLKAKVYASPLSYANLKMMYHLRDMARKYPNTVFTGYLQDHNMNILKSIRMVYNGVKLYRERNYYKAKLA